MTLCIIALAWAAAFPYIPQGLAGQPPYLPTPPPAWRFRLHFILNGLPVYYKIPNDWPGHHTPTLPHLGTET